jgi:hypothetical protein
MLICRACFKLHDTENSPDVGVCDFCDGSLCELEEIEQQIPSINEEIIQLFRDFLSKVNVDYNRLIGPKEPKIWN